MALCFQIGKSRRDKNNRETISRPWIAQPANVIYRITQTLCVLRTASEKRKRKFFTRDGSTYCVVCSAKVLKSLALHLADFCFFQYIRKSNRETIPPLLLSCFSISGAYCCLVYVCTYFAVAYIVLHLIKSQRLSRCVFIAAKFKARIVFLPSATSHGWMQDPWGKRDSTKRKWWPLAIYIADRNGVNRWLYTVSEDVSITLLLFFHTHFSSFFIFCFSFSTSLVCILFFVHFSLFFPV